MNPLTRNITRIYRAASPEEVAAGLAWYEEARQLARDLDPDNPSRAAAVIAALSPRESWTNNVRLATMAYADREQRLPTLQVNARKARAIMAGADPRDILTGKKTRNFWQNIAGDESAVTVDRHAFDVAVGKVTDDRTRSILSRKGQYESIADLYRRAAKRLGVTPAQVQAVTWVAWRNLKTAS